MNHAITVENLVKCYGSREVLGGLGFSVREGEIFALLGVNGAGKTTTLECIEGLRSYDSGSIRINGRVGIQLQSATLPVCIRPMEAVKLFAKWNKTGIDAGMLTALGIDELAKKQYGELSTGQKRRLHLALALVGDPDIVFLDEPTAGLDVEGRAALHGQIRALKAQGKTIILASHDMAEVENLCDRIAILSGGNIAFLGTVEELSEQMGKRYTIRVKTGCGEEIIESDDIGETLLTLLEGYKQQGITVSDIRVDCGTLEQDFMTLAKGERR